jgi:glycosyltransferase involved in cell wall biosynthesis
MSKASIELSILIPARNEQFLARTVDDILKHSEANTEIICVLDGAWAEPPIPQNDRVVVVYLPVSIGQRAATNLACKLAKGRYVAKLDAHCSFDQGFDRKMLEGFKVVGDEVTMVPTMRNLHAFTWKCLKCGFKKYQGPTPTSCPNCDNTKDFKKKMKWYGKPRPQSNSYCFDAEPHFQYFNDYTKREPYLTDVKTGFTETMSLQGSFWMVTKKRYWELNLGDESFPSWGSQGIQVACASWLSGGKCLVNHNTWYAHLFRTQGGDFGFPYDNPHSKALEARAKARNLLYENGWPKQILPSSWLVERFFPVKGWTEEQLKHLKENERKI